MTQEQFLEDYPSLFDRVSRYVYFRVRCRPDAEDIIATVFLELYRHLKKIDEQQGNAEQYALGIARYKVIDFWKRNSIVTTSLDEITEVFTESDRLEADLQLDNKLRFEELMASLEPAVQAIFALHYIDGLTYEAIAHIVQKRPATIRKLFSLMHKRLRKQFAL